MNRISKDDYYLNIALSVAQRGTCLKRRYGCIIVKNDEIIATGYNGSPRGEENCCDKGKCNRANAERYSDYTKCPAVHAEQNSMLEAARKDMIGATMYLACEEYMTDFDFVEDSGKRQAAFLEKKWKEDENPIPCNICTGMIKNAHIERIVNRKGDILFEKEPEYICGINKVECSNCENVCQSKIEVKEGLPKCFGASFMKGPACVFCKEAFECDEQINKRKLER